MSNFIQIIFSSMESGSIYALAALGIVLIFRTSRVTNFAQGSLGMFGAYFAASQAVKHNLPTWLAVLIGMLFAFVVGVLIDVLIMRPAKKTSATSKQILTFGIIMLLLGVTPLLFGSTPINFGKFIQSGTISFMGANISYNAILNIVIGVVVMLVLFTVLQRTKWGLGVRATASNDSTAQLMGIPTELINMGSWAIAAALSTLAALMYAPSSTITPTLMESVQIFALIACVLGGFQTFHGPVLGAYVIAFSKNIITFYVSSTWSLALMYCFVLLIIIILPNGLIGKKIAKKV